MGRSKIIADVSSNHCGDMALAKRLISHAKDYGADMVKFQLYKTEGLKRAPRTLEGLKKCELSCSQAIMLFDYGLTKSIEVFFSVFFMEAVEWCEEMGVKRYKVAARLLDEGTINAVKATLKPTIVSVAPNYKRELGWIDEFYDVDVLYCLSKYPTPLESLNFKGVDFLYDYQGFSDHTVGLTASKVAIARGARIIEKHFAIDHQTGIDAEWSMTPNELKDLRQFSEEVSLIF